MGRVSPTVFLRNYYETFDVDSTPDAAGGRPLLSVGLTPAAIKEYCDRREQQGERYGERYGEQQGEPGPA